MHEQERRSARPCRFAVATAVIDASCGLLDERAEHEAWPEARKLADRFHLFLWAFLPLVDAGSVKLRSITHSLADQPGLTDLPLLSCFAPVQHLLLFAKHLFVAAKIV